MTGVGRQGTWISRSSKRKYDAKHVHVSTVFNCVHLRLHSIFVLKSIYAINKLNILKFCNRKYLLLSESLIIFGSNEVEEGKGKIVNVRGQAFSLTTMF